MSNLFVDNTKIALNAMADEYQRVVAEEIKNLQTAQERAKKTIRHKPPNMTRKQYRAAKRELTKYQAKAVVEYEKEREFVALITGEDP